MNLKKKNTKNYLCLSQITLFLSLSLAETKNPSKSSGLVGGDEDGVREDPSPGGPFAPAVVLRLSPLPHSRAASRPLLPRVHRRRRGARREGRVALRSRRDEGPAGGRRCGCGSGFGRAGSGGRRRRRFALACLSCSRSSFSLGVPLVEHPAPLADLSVEGALGAGLSDVRGHGVDRDDAAVEEAALVAVGEEV